jgi:uncharacterized membrane protein YeiB
MTFSLAFGTSEQTLQEQWETQKRNTHIYSFLEKYTNIFCVGFIHTIFSVGYIRASDHA